MQNAIVQAQPEWDNRIEIAYLSTHGLKTFKTENSPLGIISPGEPFHIIEAGKEWLMNWYIVQEKGLTLFGPPPQTIIEPMTTEEFIEAVKAHMAYWRKWIDPAQNLPSQAYAILTVCRALYTTRYGEQLSKAQAASWAAKELPQWSATIQNALVWRRAWREVEVNPAETLPQTRRFVNFVIDLILNPA
jgi:hypothetical protein